MAAPTKVIVGLILTVTALALLLMAGGLGSDDYGHLTYAPGFKPVAQGQESESKQQEVKPAAAAGTDTEAPVVSSPNEEAVKPAGGTECDANGREVICQADERFYLKPKREGTGEGTEQAPFVEWNAPYHRKREAVRQRYQAEEEELKSKSATERSARIHTFYTIDCSYHSLWQVMTLEMSWEEVKQGGVISRVSSGCDRAPQAKREAIGKHILSEENDKNFGSFYAPTFSKLPNGDYYAPYNRPNGIWFWLNHSDLTEDVYIALDPDMLYLARLAVENIKPGHFVSQYYGYMSGHPFHKYDCPMCPDPEYYNGKDTQSAHRRLKTVDESKRPPRKKFNFDVGPPWMFTLDDLITIMPTWVGLVPLLRAKDKGLWIVEMVAYSVACAFHDIPHDVIYYGMVDNVGQEKVWDGVQITNKNTPHPVALLHFCFTWEIGEDAPPPGDFAGGDRQHDRQVQKEKDRNSPVLDYYHFSKYRVPSDWPGGKGKFAHNIFDCRTPLMQEFHTPEALPQQREGWLRTVTFLETYLPQLNKALTKWKINVANCSAEDLNLEQRLRTSHPRYWMSNYIINGTHDDRKTVDFYPSAEKKEDTK